MNNWDMLSGSFNTHKQNTDIHPDVADNILLAWPSILSGMRILQKDGVGLKALDFGCGTGGFCQELKSQGYSAVGCDSSEAMIGIAKAHLGKEIPFYHCGSREVGRLAGAPFDLITAIMVFQFVDDIHGCLANLSRVLKPNGLLVFAVFNPDFCANNQNQSRMFSGLDDLTGLGKGFMNWNGQVAIPTYIRSEDEYDRIASLYGLERMFVDYPPFIPSYLEQYPTKMETSCAEFLILGYRKL